VSFLFGSPAAGAPAPPPPPPAAPTLGAASVASAGAAEKQNLASAAGQGFSGTDVTGGQGSPAPSTTANVTGGTQNQQTKTVLGG
jgi:hypothetical protein